MPGHPPRRHGSPRTGGELAQGLGLFSIALGAAELVAPDRVARPLGLSGRENLVAAWGMREIATGIGILQRARPPDLARGRLAGDALDLATLGSPA